jgi:trk system potassium uptake protein TrkH
MTTTTFLILLIGRKFDLRQKLAIKESLDHSFLYGSRNLISSIIATTLLFEILGIILMFQVFEAKYDTLKGLWLAIFHSVSAWNNAGFSLFKDSLVGYKTSFLINFAITMELI